MDIKFLFLSGHLKDEVFVWELIEDVAIVSVYYSTLFEKEQKLSVSEGVLWHGKHTWEGGISILPGSLQIVDNRRINPMKISTWRRNGWGQIVNYTLCIWKPWGDLHLSMKWQSERWQPLHGYEMWRWQKYVYDAICLNINLWPETQTKIVWFWHWKAHLYLHILYVSISLSGNRLL